jgi:hypothetical protein
MAPLRQCSAALQVHHLRWEVACAHSETMGMEDAVVAVVPVEVIVADLLFSL